MAEEQSSNHATALAVGNRVRLSGERVTFCARLFLLELVTVGRLPFSVFQVSCAFVGDDFS